MSQVLMEAERVGKDTRCRVTRMTAHQMFWDADINNDDQFEAFIKQISRAWADAQFDHQGLHLHCNQVDASDL